MKKRIISLLLLLGTLLSMIPVTSVAAEEILPKDETPGAQTETVTEESALTDYDKLYIGADGKSTANGGRLIGLYTAYGDDATVDVVGGKWKNKMDPSGATDAILRDESPVASFAKEANGFGFHLTREQIQGQDGKYIKDYQKIGVTFPEAWAVLDTYTVEQAAKFDAVESETTLSQLYSAVRIDSLHGFWLPAAKQMDDDEAYHMRWRIDKNAYYVANFGKQGVCESAYRDAYLLANKPAGMVTVYTKSVDDITGRFGFLISYNTGVNFPANKSYTAAELNELRAEASFAEPAFSLFNGMSGTFYAVRVYDAPLTEAEKAYNAAVDMLAYAGADTTEILSIPYGYRSMLFTSLAVGVFPDSKADIEGKVDEFMEYINEQPDVSQTMYVTEGLSFFASAYQGLTTDYSEADTIEWKNALNPLESATLRGGFRKNENGGFTIEKTYDDYLAVQNLADGWYGIYLPATACPQGDYTVEIVFNPFGISYRDEDGVLQRYTDTITANGVYLPRANGHAIGPLRGLQFLCYRPAAAGAQMEKRWGYFDSRAMYERPTNQPKVTDKSWENLEPYEAVIMSVTHKRTADGGAVYGFYHNAAQAFQDMTITAGEYIAPADAGNMFQLMVGMPGTAYALRVYDRALTKAELTQNKLADLAYYFSLDVSRAMELAELMGDDASFLYDSLDTLSFTMAREEAQTLFDERVAAAWIAFENVAVRKGDGDGSRFYFTCNSATVAAMAAAGYTVELGAIVNVGGNVAPTIAGDNYDYRIGVYDSATGRNSAFFVDEDTFAVTVKYQDLDKKTALTNVFVRGYVDLIAPDGSITTYYADASTEGSGYESLFHVYNAVAESENVSNDLTTQKRMSEAVEKCYEKVTVYVNAAASANGNGTKDTPFRSFAAGFAKCKELLLTTNAPTHYTLMLADGEYGIYETQELSADGMPYAYSSLEFTSENGKATLSTTKEIGESFTKYADNVWVAQLEKEADGTYPCFRYLYVDGKIVDLAYNGGRHASDLGREISGFERDYDGPWGRAYDLYAKKTLTENSTSGYPASRPDLDAAFESYKLRFLALMEMEEIHDSGELRLNTPCKNSTDPTYVEQFEAFKLRRLILDEMITRYNAMDGTVAEKRSAFHSFVAQTHTDNSVYTQAFLALRREIASYTNINFEPFLPMVATTAIEESKYYLNVSTIGDLRDALAVGKERNEAAYNALKAKYDAADAKGKAELEEQLREAENWVGDMWFRYALRDTAPEMHQAGEWWYNIVHIQGVDYEDTVVDENGDVHVAVYMVPEEYANFFVHAHYSMKGRYVYVKNALDYVDSEGEYYYDEPAGKLYYYSESGVSGKRFERPTGDYMFVFNDVGNITFNNLRMTGADDAYLSHNDGCTGLGTLGAMGGDIWRDYVGAFTRSAILLNDSHGLTVKDCTFEELGTRAIMGVGKISNIHIENNEFGNLGANAIHFGDGSMERTWKAGTNWIENVVITDNYVHDVGREYYSAAAVWINYGKDISVLRNTIERSPYTALGIGFTYSLLKFDPTEEAYHMYNVEVAYNYVTDFLQELGDGAGIYLSGGNATATCKGYFNYVHDNYVFLSNTTGNGLGHMMVGIYFDGAATNWHCYKNVITEHSYGAAEGENDDLFKSGDRYTVAMRNRRKECYYIYLQGILTQETYNILCEENYIINVRATDPDAQKQEVYKGRVDEKRNLVEKDTHYICGVDRIPVSAEDIIYGAGSYEHEGDASLLWENDY